MLSTHLMLAVLFAPVNAVALSATSMHQRYATPSNLRSSAPIASAAIDAKTVKSLRDATGAGMMDCKKALLEADGDMVVATETLRKKGLASADKKASRAAKEGIIETYIHTGAKLGVMVEVRPIDTQGLCVMIKSATSTSSPCGALHACMPDAFGATCMSYAFGTCALSEDLR